MNQSTAVGIIAYNRPEYFKQLLDSLEKNRESQELPFFFFLDGGDGAAQEENKRLIDNASLAHKIVIAREINYGCPKNHIDSKRFLFDWCHFDRIVVLEEDLVVSSKYLEVLLHLHDWANANYTNIGTVQTWTRCTLSRAEKADKLSVVQEKFPYWSLVTYCMGRNVWDAISPMLYKYEKRFIDPLLNSSLYDKTRSKPADGPTYQRYRRWINSIAASYNRNQVIGAFNQPIWISKYCIDNWRNKFGDIPINQDQVISLAIWLAGYARLQTMVNRAIHIGAIGISSNHDIHITKLDEFDEDGSHINFCIN